MTPPDTREQARANRDAPTSEDRAYADTVLGSLAMQAMTHAEYSSVRERVAAERVKLRQAEAGRLAVLDREMEALKRLLASEIRGNEAVRILTAVHWGQGLTPKWAEARAFLLKEQVEVLP